MPAGFMLAVSIWLWFTVLFANFAEALAEGRSKAQAASLRGLKKSTWAKKYWHRQRASTAASGCPLQAPRTAQAATSCWSKPMTWSRSTAR